MRYQSRRLVNSFFFCLNTRDRDNLTTLGSTTYDGALLLYTKRNAKFPSNLTPFYTLLSGKMLKVSLSCINKPQQHVQPYKQFGEFSNPGFKDYIRSKVVIPVNNPLVPGFYFDAQNGEPYWVDFRYEGIFVYYSKCGSSEHRKPKCKMLTDIVKRHIEMVMENVSQ